MVFDILFWLSLAFIVIGFFGVVITANINIVSKSLAVIEIIFLIMFIVGSIVEIAIACISISASTPAVAIAN